MCSTVREAHHLGDFNAHVGPTTKPGRTSLGNTELANVTATASSHNLGITNTMFHLPTHNKISRMHPRSRHLIDYVITRVKDRRDVRVTNAACDADCWTDHCLIVPKLNFLIQLRSQKAPKKLNTTKLKCHQKAEELQLHMESKLKNLQPNISSVEEKLSSFRDAVHSTTLEVLGTATRRHQDWFDENDREIQSLLEEKHPCFVFTRTTHIVQQGKQPLLTSATKLSSMQD